MSQKSELHFLVVMRFGDGTEERPYKWEHDVLHHPECPKETLKFCNCGEKEDEFRAPPLFVGSKHWENPDECPAMISYEEYTCLVEWEIQNGGVDFITGPDGQDIYDYKTGEWQIEPGVYELTSVYYPPTHPTYEGDSETFIGKKVADNLAEAVERLAQSSGS